MPLLPSYHTQLLTKVKFVQLVYEAGRKLAFIDKKPLPSPLASMPEAGSMPRCANELALDAWCWYFAGRIAAGRVKIIVPFGRAPGVTSPCTVTLVVGS